jgi:hypothetical protein
LAAARHLTRVLLSGGMLFMLRAPHVGGPAMTIALPAGARTAALPPLVVVLALTGWGALQDNDHPHPHPHSQAAEATTGDAFTRAQYAVEARLTRHAE